MRPSKELIGASTGMIVLAALARQPSYGYLLVKQINDAADGIFTWSEGTVYPLLHKLEKDALIRAQWQEAESGRERKYYYISAKGRAALTAGDAHWNRFKLLMRRTDGA